MSPWTPKQFREKHFHGITMKQAREGARAANESLAQHGDDKRAVIAGIAAAKKAKVK